MRRFNIADPPFRYEPDEDPDGFKAGLFRPGPELGAKETGMSVYDLPPGQAICPYHYEYGEDEWLVVLAGRQAYAREWMNRVLHDPTYAREYYGVRLEEPRGGVGKRARKLGARL